LVKLSHAKQGRARDIQKITNATPVTRPFKNDPIGIRARQAIKTPRVIDENIIQHIRSMYPYLLFMNFFSSLKVPVELV